MSDHKFTIRYNLGITVSEKVSPYKAKRLAGKRQALERSKISICGGTSADKRTLLGWWRIFESRTVFPGGTLGAVYFKPWSDTRSYRPNGGGELGSMYRASTVSSHPVD